MDLPVLFFAFSHAIRNLHSFPTRRSSDLRHPIRQLAGMPLNRAAEAGEVAGVKRLQHQHGREPFAPGPPLLHRDRKSTRLNSSHTVISYAVFCLKKKNNNVTQQLREK